MHKLKYSLQFILIVVLFLIYKLLGLRLSSILSGYILLFLGPIFRSNKLSEKNLIKAKPFSTTTERKKILENLLNFLIR